MLEWRNGASRLAMGVVVAALFAPMTAEAQTIHRECGRDGHGAEDAQRNADGDR
jgi:hypothetical protein